MDIESISHDFFNFIQISRIIYEEKVKKCLENTPVYVYVL